MHEQAECLCWSVLDSLIWCVWKRALDVIARTLKKRAAVVVSSNSETGDFVVTDVVAVA